MKNFFIRRKSNLRGLKTAPFFAVKIPVWVKHGSKAISGRFAGKRKSPKTAVFSHSWGFICVKAPKCYISHRKSAKMLHNRIVVPEHNVPGVAAVIFNA